MNGNDKYINSRKLPKDYIMLKLRMQFNNELYEKEVIPYEIYSKMQNILINKMDDIQRKDIWI